MTASELSYVRLPARVLGCLNQGEITILLSPKSGFFEEPGIEEICPIDWLPFDLRMPNSEFDMLLKFPGGERVRVLRKDESCPEIDEC